MTKNKTGQLIWRLNAAACIVVIFSATLACTSHPDSENRAEDKEPGQSATTQATANPGIDLDCVYNHLKKPSESFHYSYKKDSSDGYTVDQEADVTPQSIDGFRLLPDGSHKPLHAVSSDASSWQAALAGLTGISGMSGTVTTFNHNSAMRLEADRGQVNGYQTVHYSIDTARWDATTRKMLGTFALGPGGFDKGDVWVTADGCPVKFILDDEMHNKDGSINSKVHYEEAMVKH